MFYDGMLLFAVLFFATALLMVLTHGKAIHSGNYYYLAYLLLISYGYFAWQWNHGGQTLGMRAWRVRLLGSDGLPPGWQSVSRRFALALVSWCAAGAGFLWALFDKRGLTFHDRFSNTELFLITRGDP